MRPFECFSIFKLGHSFEGHWLIEARCCLLNWQDSIKWLDKERGVTEAFWTFFFLSFIFCHNQGCWLIKCSISKRDVICRKMNSISCWWNYFFHAPVVGWVHPVRIASGTFQKVFKLSVSAVATFWLWVGRISAPRSVSFVSFFCINLWFLTQIWLLVTKKSLET